MAREREFQARTLEEAIVEAARFLSVPAEAVHYRLVDEGRLGVLGFGARPVRIVVEIPEHHSPEPAAPARAPRPLSAPVRCRLLMSIRGRYPPWPSWPEPRA